MSYEPPMAEPEEGKTGRPAPAAINVDLCAHEAAGAATLAFGSVESALVVLRRAAQILEPLTEGNGCARRRRGPKPVAAGEVERRIAAQTEAKKRWAKRQAAAK